MEIPTDALAQFTSPFDGLVGLRVTAASSERCVGEVEIRQDHLQAYGIVHGGVHATLIEVTCSIGASLWAVDTGNGAGAMGVSNHTDFLRSVSAGVLVCEATRIQAGGTLQLWQALVTDAEGTPIAHGKVRLMNVKTKD